MPTTTGSDRARPGRVARDPLDKWKLVQVKMQPELVAKIEAIMLDYGFTFSEALRFVLRHGLAVLAKPDIRVC